MADRDRKGDQEVRIVDPDTQDAAKVDSSGRLQITSASQTPADTTAVSETIQDDISTTAVDETYTIPNGDVLNIQTLQAGSEKGATGGSKVELYYDSNGDGTGMNLITALYVDGTSTQADISEEYTGDGTARILLRAVALAGAAREIFARWKGFVT